ncbi:transcriptional regulator, partial [Morganella morganii]|uniref:PapB/FocB family fimbrial expression transcriptional regulator n=1 Tax=Morganella morganii TaxID=582 RepID=UPI0015F42E15
MPLSEDILLVGSLPPHRLIQGQMDKIEFCLLMTLTSINNIKIINALEAYLVLNQDRAVACRRFGVNPGYFSRRLKVVTRVYQLVGALKLYYAGKPCN